MTRRGPRGYADLHKLPEDERIVIIGKAAARGETVGVFIDNDEAKITRYVRKIEACFPTVKLLKRAPAEGGVALLQFGLKDTPPEALNG